MCSCVDVEAWLHEKSLLAKHYTHLCWQSACKVLQSKCQDQSMTGSTQQTARVTTAQVVADTVGMEQQTAYSSRYFA